MLRWGLPALVAMVLLTWIAVAYSEREDPSAANPDGSIEGLTSVLTRTITDEMVRFSFEDATADSGVAFRHFPATRSSLLPEDMGPGLAVGDVDGDGDLDLFLVNFAGPATAPLAESDAAGRCALWRNDGDGRFTDVSVAAGLDLTIFGQGAAFGDFDDDGDLDLYVTAWGKNRLMRNAGDGTFTDVTDAAGVGDDGFGGGCAWADYDADGDLDLYVTNYVDFEPPDARFAKITPQYGAEVPYTINPSSYRPQANRLYRNDGNGSFSDVAVAAGVANPSGRSLGAIWFDFDLDGLLDLYVANDVSANGVFRNVGDGTFADVGASSLAADYRGAMGLAVTDYGNDGDLDLFVTHWVAQENAFFENMIAQELLDDSGEARLLFMDSADRTGLGQISLKVVGWSAGFCDFDDDGWPDLWVLNGNTLEQADQPTALQRQQSHVFRQEPGRGFFEIGARASPALSQQMVARCCCATPPTTTTTACNCGYASAAATTRPSAPSSPCGQANTSSAPRSAPTALTSAATPPTCTSASAAPPSSTNSRSAGPTASPRHTPTCPPASTRSLTTLITDVRRSAGAARGRWGAPLRTATRAPPPHITSHVAASCETPTPTTSR